MMASLGISFDPGDVLNDGYVVDDLTDEIRQDSSGSSNVFDENSHNRTLSYSSSSSNDDANTVKSGDESAVHSIDEILPSKDDEDDGKARIGASNEAISSTITQSTAVFNFRLCSVLTVPVNSNNAESRSQSAGSKDCVKMRRPASTRPGSGDSSRRNKNRSKLHRRHRKKQKDQQMPDYHRAALTPFGIIRRFDQHPPPPLTVLYSSLNDLLSPRLGANLAVPSTDQTELENTKFRVVLSGRSSTPTPAFQLGAPGTLTPKLSVRHRVRRSPQKTSESSVSDVDTGSSDDDAGGLGSSKIVVIPPVSSAISDDSVMLRRNRELMLHSGLRRPLERLLSSSDSAVRIGYDASNERLNSLLKVRQLQTTPALQPLSATSSMVPSRCQTPSANNNNNNNALTHNIRELFLKRFAPPPTVTITSPASAKLRDSSTIMLPVEGSTVPVQPRPATGNLSNYRPPPLPPPRPKSSAMVTNNRHQTVVVAVVPRHVGNNSKDENSSSSPNNNSSSPSNGQQHTSTQANSRGRGRGGEQGGDDMGDAPDPPANDGRRPAATRAPRVSVTSSQQQTYYLGSHNGAALVEAPLIQLGWKRVTDKNSDQFRFKWCDIKAAINFASFREGEQMVNHLPNNQLLTNKLGLLNSLQDYDRQLSQSKRRGALKLTSFYPETYRLDDRADREAFLQIYKDGEIWICKPTGLNQGIGIHLVRTTEEARALADDRENRMVQARGQVRQPMTRIVQRYILRPLLLDGRKFDIRCYMLIGCTSPWLVLYHRGYIRLSIHHYHPDSPDITVHLTNQYIQKKDSTYKEVKENTAWNMDQFNAYINDNLMEQKGLERDWAFNTLDRQIQRIIVHIFSAVKNKLSSKVGFFELYGLDFMIDENMKVYLIEVNTNPSLSVNPKPLADCIPGVVDESVHLAIECFEKARKGQPLLPLKAISGFNVVYHGNRKTIDFGPGDKQDEVDDANESASTASRRSSRPSNTVLDATLKQALSVRSPGPPAFESKQALQRFQQQIFARGPSFTSTNAVTTNQQPSTPNSPRVQLKYSNRSHNSRSRTAVREFYTYAPSTSDEENGVVNNEESDNGASSGVRTPGGGIRQFSTNNWEKSANLNSSPNASTKFKTYNWPARDPASLQMKRRQELANSGARIAWNSPPMSSRSVKTAIGSGGDGAEEMQFSGQEEEEETLDTTRKSIPSSGGEYSLFKPFRIVFVEDANNSPPPERATSVRRTRSLSPVKVNNQLAPPNNTTQRSPSPKPAPKPSQAPPVVTPRPRTVRQTLSTSVATVRVSTNNGDVIDDPSSSPLSPPSPSDGARYNNFTNNLQGGTTITNVPSANGLQRQVTFAPMTLPTVRLQLTQVQFPYPVIAGQTIASVPASALGNAGVPIATSPYLTTTTRMKRREPKDRGN